MHRILLPVPSPSVEIRIGTPPGINVGEKIFENMCSPGLKIDIGAAERG
jgi:hypothetical protein